MIWVSLPHATFGLVIGDDDVVRDAPPIARWALGHRKQAVLDYLEHRGADVRFLP